ncbi:(2Fe-2S)-binding protein [Tomitella biformata]|uniref:(2Fe-2S)-binding protein n=1 Tax=Tomitella biformata TaxID=630403 RepID=UPI000465B589|nr:(2Fe-2S)-binding protein [Tomitella biformata]
MSPELSDIGSAIAASKRVGAYFDLRVVDGPQWRPFAELANSAADIEELVRRTRAILAVGRGLPEDEIELRAAASSFHLNSVAKVLSPVFGCAVLADAVPDLSAQNLAWLPGPSHVLEVGVRAAVGGAGLTDEQIVERVHAAPLDAVAELGDGIHEATGLSQKVLWGNVASAFNGAFLVLRGQRPDDEDRAHEVLHAILEHGRLATAGRFLPDEWDADRFSRNSCCLFYRVPGGGLCGDCVLAERPTEIP